MKRIDGVNMVFYLGSKGKWGGGIRIENWIVRGVSYVKEKLRMLRL